MAHTTAFAVRTSDQAWIARHGGITQPNGRTIVQVPASKVERITFAGHAMLRHVFTDAPADHLGQTALVCPARHVEGA